MQRALSVFETGYALGDVRTALADQRARLWLGPDMACVTTIVIHPQFRECVIWLIGGDNMRDWFNELFDTLERFAADNDCRYVSGAGRL